MLSAPRRMAVRSVPLARPLRMLRIQANGVCVELEWSDGSLAPLVPLAAPSEPGETPASGQEALVAPTVGVFYRAPQPGAEPFVTEGAIVLPGQQVAIIEAMKLMIPVEADRGGRIMTSLVSDGQSVEYGQPLFTLEPDAMTAAHAE